MMNRRIYLRTPASVSLQQHLKRLYPHLTDEEIRRQLAVHGEDEPLPSLLVTITSPSRH